MTDEARARFLELVADFETAMLVTVDREGRLRSRPMQIARTERTGDLWFVTPLASGKTEEIAADVRCAITLQSKRHFVSITGTAELVQDRELVNRLWSDTWRPWFPHGPDDPELVLIHFEAEEAEYWDTSGIHGARHLFRAAKAFVKGERPGPEGEEPEDHASIPL
jgi:general stress protein 26